jgi:hypothetical protein
MKRHIICERDVGLFSLIQQVIANIPWALQAKRIPIVHFHDKTCYWTPNGYHDSDTVWEYYFEPVVSGHPAASIPQQVRTNISTLHPSPFEVGYFADEYTFVSNHFGDHPELKGKTLFIPFLLDDPDERLRQEASAVIRTFIRPRAYVQAKAEQFFADWMKDRYIIGVHIRGTDAVSKQEIRWHRQGSLRLPPRADDSAGHRLALPIPGARAPMRSRLPQTAGSRLDARLAGTRLVAFGLPERHEFAIGSR